MADEAEYCKNKKMGDHKESVKAIGNSWIICRSQSHSGRIYYFNTLTGKSAWNLSDGEIEKAQLLSKEAASGTHIGDCPEPPEPPMDTPHCSSQRPAPQKESGARVYNKQIINNQFAKPYAIPGFSNTHCPCSSLTAINDTGLSVTPMYNPTVWAIPPSHQIFLTPAVASLTNQAQSIFNTPNVPVQNTSVPLPSYFQIGNQSAQEKSPYLQEVHKNGPKFNSYPSRWKQGFSPRNFQSNANNDLRDILSSRRKDQRNNQEELGWNKYHEPHGADLDNSCEKGNLTADDLYPSDIDEEWLEGSTVGDISYAWKIFSGFDCWFVVANTYVMLNNMKILSNLIKPEKQIYLITPLDVMKRLRSATGSSVPRLVQRARCAIRFAVQQMNKVPAALKKVKGCTINSCCLELIQQNHHVLLLVDENDIQSQKNIDGVSLFTIYQLKECLKQNGEALTAKTHDNITVTISLNGDENDEKTSPSTHEAPTVEHAELTDKLSSVQHKKIEIQTEQMTPIKKTANACVQTDFEVARSMEILKSPSVVETLNIDHTLKINAADSHNEIKEESEVAPKKITLKRNNSSTSSDPIKKTQFRWRKQRAKPPITITTSPKPDVVPNKQTLQTKSPPSSLISISDLISPQHYNISDHAQSIEFSDVSVPTPQPVEREVNDESSVDVISNSVVDDCIPKLNKGVIINESDDNDEEDIVMFQVTGDLMDDYLSRGCDEWVSRFVQIMEEALTQTLQLEPCFSDPAMPPPWSVHEATVCVKRKFENHIKIVLACNRFGVFLLKISDSRGKIFPDLNPSDFMRMYSYGVYLIEALQSVLNDSEDLQIAIESLSKLLNDIKNPNLDVTQNVFMDTFLTNDKHEHTANITEPLTDAGEDIIAAAKISPPKIHKQASSETSPTAYNLRSSQRSIEQTEKEVPQVNFIRNIGKEESFFSSLRLQKNSTSTDNLPHTETCSFSPLQKICLKNQNLTDGRKEDKTENNEQGPKIIRTFNLCPEIEAKLKSKANGLDYVYENYAEDETCYGNEFYHEDNDYIDDTYEANTQDGMDEEYCSKSDEIGAQMLKWFIDRTTYPLHRVLVDMQSFCEDTSKDLHSEEKMDQLYIKNLHVKTIKVQECLNNLCNHLNSILRRKDTKTKFRDMIEEVGIIDCEINDTQVAEYGEVVRKYLDQANILYESVNLIAAAIKERE